MRYALRIAALAVALVGCGCGRDDKAELTTDDLGPVETQSADYEAWGGPTKNANGFVDTGVDRCDTLLYSCLDYAAGAVVDYHKAEDPDVPGRWYRDDARTCGPGNGSQTSFSRDMAIGLAFCMWQAADTQGAKDFLAYNSAHGGLMGDGDPNLTEAGPFVTYLFKTIVAKAESTPLPEKPADPNPDAGTSQQLVDPLHGFVADITVLGVLLDGLMTGALNDAETFVLKDQANRQADNALFHTVYHKYLDGKQGEALRSLNNTQWFPHDRLPSSADRKAYYLWERDEPGADWNPDPSTPARVYSGTDYRFVVAVLSGTLREAKPKK